jgi:hypothetical protein
MQVRLFIGHDVRAYSVEACKYSFRVTNLSDKGLLTLGEDLVDREVV